MLALCAERFVLDLRVVEPFQAAAGYGFFEGGKLARLGFHEMREGKVIFLELRYFRISHRHVLQRGSKAVHLLEQFAQLQQRIGHLPFSRLVRRRLQFLFQFGEAGFNLLDLYQDLGVGLGVDGGRSDLILDLAQPLILV